jgi:hypothetical protein
MKQKIQALYTPKSPSKMLLRDPSIQKLRSPKIADDISASVDDKEQRTLLESKFSL